ncbi:MAG: hypothetical protein ACRDRJ_07565 [Streptosporangiaceae bacterium]
MSAERSPEDAVRKFYDCYTEGRPEDFGEVVAPDYLDYGHQVSGGLIRWTRHALIGSLPPTGR